MGGVHDPVFVVQEAPTGRWIAECTDQRCGYFPHDLAYSPRRAAADAAATRHRKLLRTLPVYEENRRKDICEHCGQSERANAELRDLVGQLEARLAELERREAS